MYSVFSQKKSPTEGYLYEYVADTTADLANILAEKPESAQGSTVIVIANSAVYMLDGNGNWAEL